MAQHPQAIGKYRIARPLGKGAMGMVYEGFDPIIERKVAIKTILAEYLEAAEMEEAIARFKREAQAAGRLQHPGIVGVYEYGQDGDMAFIVMEYVDGKELKRMLADGKRLEPIDVFEIMKQLLGALDYSHKQGVVHRDIKPANLMILPGPKVKVMDFGIARLESSSLTQAGTVVGTPTHMSPEQLMGLPADGRADLWSSGVILYELLTGVSPFLAETPATVMHNVLQRDPAKPSTLNPAIPAGFDAVVARALAKKADDRFQTAREFQAALVHALQGKTMRDVDRTLSPAEAARHATRSAMARAPALALSPEALAEIESSLSRHVGPLAKVLVKQSQGEATSIEEFFRALAENIPNARRPPRKRRRRRRGRRVRRSRRRRLPRPRRASPAMSGRSRASSSRTPRDNRETSRNSIRSSPLISTPRRSAGPSSPRCPASSLSLPMTTIVVVRKDQSAVIAADSLTTFGTTRLAPTYDRHPHKVTTYGDSFLGVAGSAAHRDLRHFPEAPSDPQGRGVPQPERGGGRPVRVEPDDGDDRQSVGHLRGVLDARSVRVRPLLGDRIGPRFRAGGDVYALRPAQQRGGRRPGRRDGGRGIRHRHLHAHHVERSQVEVNMRVRLRYSPWAICGPE